MHPATTQRRVSSEVGHDGLLAAAYALVAVPLLLAMASQPMGDTQRFVMVAAVAPFAVAAVYYARRWLVSAVRVRRELQRAATEWPRLCRELAAASRAGIDLHPLLQQLGYHEAATRRRLAQSARRWGAKLLRHEAVATRAASTVTPAVAGVVVPRRVRLELDEPPARDDPGVQLIVGALLTVACVLVMTYVPTRLWGWFLFGAVAGLGMFLGGVEAERRRGRQLREVGRALRERDQLAAEAAAMRQQGGSLVGLLQRAGFRDYDVRQWLLRHLEG